MYFYLRFISLLRRGKKARKIWCAECHGIFLCVCCFCWSCIEKLLNHQEFMRQTKNMPHINWNIDLWLASDIVRLIYIYTEAIWKYIRQLKKYCFRHELNSIGEDPKNTCPSNWFRTGDLLVDDWKLENSEMTTQQSTDRYGNVLSSFYTAIEDRIWSEWQRPFIHPSMLL